MQGHFDALLEHVGLGPIPLSKTDKPSRRRQFYGNRRRPAVEAKYVYEWVESYERVAATMPVVCTAVAVQFEGELAQFGYVVLFTLINL